MCQSQGMVRSLIAAAFALSLAACGADDQTEPEAPPTKATPTVIEMDPVDEPEATSVPPADEEPEPDAAACDLAGSHPAHVTIVDDGDSVTVTWAGQRVASTDTTGFYASVFDANGNGGQMGVKYLDGDQIAYFSDADGTGNLSGEAVVNGTEVTATFPQPGFKIAKWNAAYTLAGSDVGKCPSDGAFTLPFP